MKIKTFKIRIEKEAESYDLEDYLKNENFMVENIFSSLQTDAEGSYWEVIVFYKENIGVVPLTIKNNLYEELKDWTIKKAAQLNVSVSSLEQVSQVFLFAKDYQDICDKSDFLIRRNYGKIKFEKYGREILEIFRKYQ